MSDINNEETITESFFWVTKTDSIPYTKDCIEYEALKLTNLAKVILVEIKADTVDIKNDNTKKGLKYSIVASGTKQKLLLLKHLLQAWLQGAMFRPKEDKKVTNVKNY